MRLVVDDKKIKKELVRLNKSIRAAYLAWKKIVENDGFEGLRQCKGFRFEKLRGQREGQMSCRLSRGYRIIFIKYKSTVIVTVLEINKHEY